MNKDRDEAILDIVKGVLNPYAEVTFENLYEAFECANIARKINICACGMRIPVGYRLCYPCRLKDKMSQYGSTSTNIRE